MATAWWENLLLISPKKVQCPQEVLKVEIPQEERWRQIVPNNQSEAVKEPKNLNSITHRDLILTQACQTKMSVAVWIIITSKTSDQWNNLLMVLAKSTYKDQQVLSMIQVPKDKMISCKKIIRLDFLD